MKKRMMAGAVAILVLAILVVGSFLAARTSAPEVSLDEVQALYGQDARQIEVAVVTVNYGEEGSGPTLGRLRGVMGNGAIAFKGIPYAAPPIGALRWRAPQPAMAWADTRDASDFGNACIQQGRGRPGEALGAPESEDCLYLNVWRPRGNISGLPVMVWIHGGALTQGAASKARLDGAEFAKRGIVLVSINYRLGWLGFFGHPALTREAAEGGLLGNYGLMDQIAALQWVQRNIAAFGGDPKRVTIFGESAGAASVLALMVSPAAEGLFAGAISQSGYWRGPWARVSEEAPDGRESAEASGVAALASIGVHAGSAESLRGLTTDQVRELPPHGFEGAGFILDGRLLPEDLWVAFRAGRQAPVPLLIGATDLETPNAETPESKELLAKFLAPYMSDEQQASLAPVYGGQQVFDQHLSSDFTFAAHAWSLARLHRMHGHATYRYRFAAMSDAMAEEFSGTPHSGELEYVFGTLDNARWQMGERDRRVSDATIAYWSAFAHERRLQPAGLPACPTIEGNQILLISNEGAVCKVDDRAARYDALARIIDPQS